MQERDEAVPGEARCRALAASAALLLRRKLAKRRDDQRLELGDGARNSCEAALGFALAVAHPPQGLKGLRTDVGKRGDDRTAVRRAIRMREMQDRGSRARNEEPPLVNGKV